MENNSMPIDSLELNNLYSIIKNSNLRNGIRYLKLKTISSKEKYFIDFPLIMNPSSHRISLLKEGFTYHKTNEELEKIEEFKKKPSYIFDLINVIGEVELKDMIDETIRERHSIYFVSSESNYNYNIIPIVS